VAGERHRARLRALLRAAHVRASDLAAYEAAFVHQSAAREQHLESNERLEFLGDAVVGFVAAAWLYEQHPQAPEGWLTRRKAAIVRDAALARTAERLGFGDLVRLGEGAARSGGAQNRTILADAFEAFVGALFATHGEAKARRFLIEQHVSTVDLSEESVTDPKSRLQNVVQERYRQIPRYRDTSVGTAQEPRFTSEVLLKDEVLGAGSGRSKKMAQLQAAAKALAALSTTSKAGR